MIYNFNCNIYVRFENYSMKPLTMDEIDQFAVMLKKINICANGGSNLFAIFSNVEIIKGKTIRGT